jgi:hypothetical protein
MVGIPPDGSLAGWKAENAGAGPAEVWICAYKASTSAFDAVQRARAEAQTVKFQQGASLVLVKWNNVPKASLTAGSCDSEGRPQLAGVVEEEVTVQ